MKIMVRIAVVILLLLAGFGAGFPIGQSIGFSTGSEWALVQADILAREAGVFMPVHIEKGMFRVALKQPRHLYREAWQLADRHYEAISSGASCERPLTDNTQVKRSAYIVQ